MVSPDDPKQPRSDDKCQPGAAAAHGTEGSGPQQVRPARSIPLTVLMIIAVFSTLYLARAIVIPLVLAILASVMLKPIVDWFGRLRVPKSLAAIIVLAGIAGIISYGVYAAGQPVFEWVAEFPSWLREAEHKIRDVQGSVQKLSDATESMDKLADQVMERRENVPNVVIKRASLTSFLLGWTHEMLAGLGITCILVYFLLTNGDTFLRKLVKVIPKFRDKKQAVEIVRQVESEICHYVLTITICNVVLGVTVGIAMMLWGMPSPLIIGLMAAFVNFVPYIGPLVGAGIVGVIAFVEFGTLASTGMITATYFALTAVEGTIVTPTVLGSRFSINPVVLLVGLMILTSIWGISGAVLAVPILVAIKIIFDRIEHFASIGELLGR